MADPPQNSQTARKRRRTSGYVLGLILVGWLVLVIVAFGFGFYLIGGFGP